MSKKLYHCTIEIGFYALAENERDAMSCATDAVDDLYLPDYCIAELARKSDPIEADWDWESLVYGTREDITLKQAMLEIQ
jgi:hypothetical protein